MCAASNIRVIPENEKPPARRVDIYFLITEFFFNENDLDISKRRTFFCDRRNIADTTRELAVYAMADFCARHIFFETFVVHWCCDRTDARDTCMNVFYDLIRACYYDNTFRAE